VGYRLDRVHRLRRQLQQLRQDVRIAGGLIILLTWLYLSALAVLFGAVINAQSEKQTRKDSCASLLGRPRCRIAATALATSVLKRIISRMVRITACLAPIAPSPLCSPVLGISSYPLAAP
jgi:hypothetical protein